MCGMGPPCTRSYLNIKITIYTGMSRYFLACAARDEECVPAASCALRPSSWPCSAWGRVVALLANASDCLDDVRIGKVWSPSPSPQPLLALASLHASIRVWCALVQEFDGNR